MIDGDLISRQAVLDRWEELSVRGRTEFDQEIMMLPSVRTDGRRIKRMIVCENCLHNSICNDKDNMTEEYSCIYHTTRNNILYAELENIKTEMESRVKLNNDLENYDISTGLSMALGILDKHIYELKGDK